MKEVLCALLFDFYETAVRIFWKLYKKKKQQILTIPFHRRNTILYECHSINLYSYTVYSYTQNVIDISIHHVSKNDHSQLM